MTSDCSLKLRFFKSYPDAVKVLVLTWCDWRSWPPRGTQLIENWPLYNKEWRIVLATAEK